MSGLKLGLTVALLIISVLLIIIVMLQGDRAAGLGVMGSSTGNDSYWSKNKGNSIEGTLEKYTKIGGVIFMAIALVINFIN